MAYLSNREAAPPKQKRTTLTSVRSQEGQVFERLAKQAEIHQHILKEKKQLVDSSIIDPSTGKEFFKPQTNSLYKIAERPSSQQKISSSLYDRHR